LFDIVIVHGNPFLFCQLPIGILAMRYWIRLLNSPSLIKTCLHAAVTT
jgi:hypothetical protein